MAKPILHSNQIEDIENLLGYAACALDNLFVGLQEHPTGIRDCPECFTKNDIKLFEKAHDRIWKLKNSFDGTRKQRN